MTRIQSSTGLITGIPIQDTVDKLMIVAAQPKTTLANRTKALESQKLAVTQLTSLLVAFQFETRQLAATSLFDSRQATSSDASLTAAISSGGASAAGNYLFTPVQTASAQQLLSQSFAAGAAVGAGTISFGKGGFVDAGISLAELNSGGGVEHGKIRITDRSGATAIVDLSFARTVDDVLDAISTNTGISVTATAVGDTFTLTDTSGGTGNLKVQEIAGGSTAAHLGLAGIDVAASSAAGGDVFALHSMTALSILNDGTGVQLRSGNDLSVALVDGSTVEIDLGSSKSLGDVITALNAASPTKLSAAISSDGNRIELKDLTTGAGTFAVTNVGSGTAASDLGLTKTAVGDTITGRRLVSGLKDTLVSSLKGGAGLGTLGHVDITNRNNVTSDVNLAAAETLGGIVAAINSQAAGVTASINSARNGIQLSDSTGATASNFIVADGDANNTATALGITANSSATTVTSGGLDRQQISAATLLSSLNGGTGIDVGDFKITGTNGVTRAVDLDKVGDVATTIGDVLTRINDLDGVGVEARINARGDGIILVDTAGGAGKITVVAVGGDKTAADLRLLGTSVEATVDGIPKEVIDGTATATVSVDADDTLSDVVTKINTLDRGVAASILNDGTRQRLSISVGDSGAANELLIDTGATGLSLQEISSARDALVLYGTSGSGGAVVSSSTNTFQDIVDGLNLTINQGTLEPVTVSIKASSSSIVSNVKEFVAAYNSIRSTLDTVTEFNAEDLTTGILFGTSEALRVDSDLSIVMTSRFFGVGKFDSLAAIGITVDDKGKLSLDESKLSAAFNTDPDALKKLFTDEDRGLAAKLDSVLETLAGEDSSLLASRTDSLTRIIEANNKRIDEMTARLERQRERLLLEFYSIETTVARLQDNLTALSALQIIPPLTSTRYSNR
jgi:flagellar hook-associated protein 2